MSGINANKGGKCPVRSLLLILQRIAFLRAKLHKKISPVDYKLPEKTFTGSRNLHAATLQG